MWTELHAVTLVATHTPNPRNVYVDYDVFKARRLDSIGPFTLRGHKDVSAEGFSV